MPRPAPSSSKTSRPKKQIAWLEHTVRQLKLLVPGAAVTYYLGTIHDFAGILHGQGGSWAQYILVQRQVVSEFSSVLYRLAALGASLLGVTTVVLFIYVLLLPWLTGEEPDVRYLRFLP